MYTVPLRDGTKHYVDFERTESNDEWVAFVGGDGDVRLLVPLADIAWVRQDSAGPPF
jgi:hypothetical protein